MRKLLILAGLVLASASFAQTNTSFPRVTLNGRPSGSYSLGLTDAVSWGDVCLERAAAGQLQATNCAGTLGAFRALTFRVLEGGAAPTHYTIFQGQAQAGDITYTLPAASATGALLNAAGTLSWGALPLASLTDGATVGQPLLAGGAGGDPAWGALPLAGLTDDAAAGKVLTSGGAGDPAWSATPALGAGSGVGGSLTVNATLGAELTTNGTFTGDATGWVLTAGWTYNANAVDHDSDGTTTLSQALAPVALTAYELTFTVSNRTAGSVYVQFGGGQGETVDTDGTYTRPFIANDVTTLIFTPSNDARLTIDDVSVKAYTLGSVTLGDDIRAAYIGDKTVRWDDGAGAPIDTYNGQWVSKWSGIAGENNYKSFYWGFRAGENAEDGLLGNSVVGYYSGINITTGGDNTLWGSYCGTAITEGGYNTAIGADPMARITVGDNNVAVGKVALWGAAGDSNRNTAIGSNSGYNTTQGAATNDNTLLGFNSGYDLSTGDWNIAVGSYAQGITTGSQNIQIGGSSNTTDAALINSIAIGYDVDLPGYNMGTLGNSGFRLWYMGSAAQAEVRASQLAIPLTSDATIYLGQAVMVDAGTDARIDVNGAGGTLPLGVLVGDGGATAGSTAYVAISGKASMTPAEDVPVTRGHVLYQSATAGYVNDNAALQAAGTNIGRALYSEPVTYIIDPTGCGGGGCVNVATETITLSSAPGWAVYDRVVYWNSGGTTITGLTDGAVYWVKTISGADVTLSTTRGGAAVGLNSQGDDATQYLQRLPLAVIALQ